MNLKMISIGLGLSAAVGLLGCVNIPSAPRGVLVAKQACEINALAEERDAMVKSISTVNNIIPYQKESTEDHRYTILAEKLRRYSGEVEASYRFVTASCNSYNLCMEENHYDEQRCAGTRQAWSDSHSKFNELAIAINDDTGKWYNEHHRGPHHGKRRRECDRSECNVQGGVFSTQCCYDGD
jgi:hypothetical protein